MARDQREASWNGKGRIRTLFPDHTDPLTMSIGCPGRPPTAHAAVLSALRGGTSTIDEIRRHFHWMRRSRAQVRRSLDWLEARGWIETCWRVKR